ncbi:hypothetical protein IG631_12777 [Alternaria alternata]|nr:hypothetical protein IG631_12777 [Alternaria alternata]
MSSELSRRSRYCMSETSPPKPTTTSSLNFRRRLTSVKRAREPYEAVVVCQPEPHYQLCCAIPRLSAAMTTPSLNLAASTEVPVTIGL